MWYRYRIFPLCLLIVLAGACRYRTRVAVGLYPIKLSNGSCVYLKREARGLSYDVVGLSENADPCVALNPDSDYIYSEMGPFDVYYAVSDREITLYSTSELRVPPHPSGELQVRNVRLLPLQFRDFRETYPTKGISRVLVPVAYKWCMARHQ
jgi:hypothetical protein